MTEWPKRRIVKGRGLYIRLTLGQRLQAAQGVQQAVFKVISYAHGEGVGRSIDYISRKGKLELETEEGELIQGREETKALLKTWSRDFDHRVRGRDSVHMTFSMPRGSSPTALRKSVRTVLKISFPGHEAVFAIHEDRPHPHAHVVLKVRSRETGKKLRLDRDNLYEIRKTFAEAACEQGVRLSATPRAARGVGTKAISRAVYQLRKRGEVPRVDRQATEEIMQEPQPHSLSAPWETAMAARNRIERQAYESESKKLRLKASVEQDPKKREILNTAAQHLTHFAQAMPTPKTQRQKVIEKLHSRNQPSKSKENGFER